MTIELKGGDKVQPKLSNDLNVITAEINAYQRVAGEAIFEIGRRLKGVRDNPEEYGFEGYRDWERWCNDELNMTRQHANRFVKAFERFAESGTPGFRLPTSITVLVALTDFTDEELEQTYELPSGESKKPTEMSRREIEELKKTLRQVESQRDAERAERERLEEENEQLAKEADKPPKVETVYPSDYEQIKAEKERLQKELEEARRNNEEPYGVKLGLAIYDAFEELSKWQKEYSWIVTDKTEFQKLVEGDPNLAREFNRLDKFWQQLSVAFHGVRNKGLYRENDEPVEVIDVEYTEII